MAAARKSVVAMSCLFFSPLMNRGVANAQLTHDLRNEVIVGSQPAENMSP